jgi:hypothetical protein
MTFPSHNQKTLEQARYSARHLARFANAACDPDNPRWEDSALSYFRILRNLRARFEVTESTQPAQPVTDAL